MWAVASVGVVSTGGVQGGEEDVDEHGVDPESEDGEGKPELPSESPPGLLSELFILLGRPCWKRQRVPYRQKPKAEKVRQRAPRGFHSLVCGENLGLRGKGVFSPASGDSREPSTFSPSLPSMCRKLQRVPKGQTPKERKVRHGIFLRRRRAGRCSVGLCTNRQRLP